MDLAEAFGKIDRRIGKEGGHLKWLPLVDHMGVGAALVQ